MSGADLSGANLSGANLHGANLSGANLSECNFTNALFDITNVKVIENNSLEKVNYIRVAIPRPGREDKYKYDSVSYQQYKEWLQEQDA